MVAYNFTGGWTGKETKDEQKAEVFRKINEGIKCRTTRKNPRAKVGDKLQLYWGQRTKDCELIKEVVCTQTYQVHINCEKRTISFPSVGGRSNWKTLAGVNVMIFAKGDGFDTLNGFFDFFETGTWWVTEW